MRGAAAARACAELLVKPAMFGSCGDDRRRLLLVADHVVEADALNRLGADAEAALILARQEALRHQREQVDGADEQRDRDGHRHGAVKRSACASVQS